MFYFLQRLEVMTKEEIGKQNEAANGTKPVLSAVKFQFLYRKKRNNEFSEFTSIKKTLREAMDDFLTKKQRLYDIDEEVKVTYEDGSEDFIQIDVRQDWDLRWYFVFENQMICGNGYICQFNGI